MTARWMNVFLGTWLGIAAALAGNRAALANNLFLGTSIFLIAFLSMGVDSFRRLNTALGAWAVVSPFILGYGDSAAALNDVVVGILVVAASLWTPRPRGLHPQHH